MLNLCVLTYFPGARVFQLSISKYPTCRPSFSNSPKVGGNECVRMRKGGFYQILCERWKFIYFRLSEIAFVYTYPHID